MITYDHFPVIAVMGLFLGAFLVEIFGSRNKFMRNLITLIAAGGALFYISDAMLFARLLFSASHSVDWAIMITYYAAQLLFGLSCIV